MSSENIIEVFKEFSSNTTTLAALNEKKRGIVKRQNELQTTLANYLTNIGTEAVKYQDKIFSLETKVTRGSLPQKAQRALLAANLTQYGVPLSQIDSIFKQFDKEPRTRNIIAVTNNA